jgi:branched-chain amino acid transport system ATP-binding protein
MNDNKILEVHNLTKKFGGLIAVNAVSIHVNEGEIVGLIGANGAGKTTMFNMIAGAFPPTSGTIKFKGREIQNMPDYKICRLGIARTHQLVKPFRNLSVLDNTVVGALIKYPQIDKAREKACEVCELINLDKRINVSAAGLNLPELKRMELARALATEPKLLLLDEVMAGLNNTESARFMETIQKIRATGITIIMIEHVMKAVMTLSDRIYVLNQGGLIAEGIPAEITQNPEVIKSYLGEKRYAEA